jgi:hypothetical protein
LKQHSAAPSVETSEQVLDAQTIAKNIAALKARQKAGAKKGKKVGAELDSGTE